MCDRPYGLLWVVRCAGFLGYSITITYIVVYICNGYQVVFTILLHVGGTSHNVHECSSSVGEDKKEL